MSRWIHAFVAAALAEAVVLAPVSPGVAEGIASREANDLLAELRRLGMYAEEPRAVRDAAGFAAALGSNRTLLLEPGVYDLTDGGSLSGLENVTLAAARPGTVRLVSRNAYGDVLVLSGARNVSLVNLVVGHLDAPACTGGALVVRQSRRVRVRGCRLYGSGAVGVAAVGVEDLVLEEVEIDDCHGHIATVTDSRNVVFEGGDLHDNQASLQIRASQVTFRGTRIRDNRHWSGGALFVLDAAAEGLHGSAAEASAARPSTVALPGVVLRGNRFPALTNGKGALDLGGAGLADNYFDGPHRWVLASVANLRDAPDPGGGLVGRLPIGTRVVVLQEREGWARIVADGLGGFLQATLLAGEPPSVPGMLAALEAAKRPAERRAWAERAAALAPQSVPVLEKLVAALEEAGDPAAAAKARHGLAQARERAGAPPPEPGDGLVGRRILPCGLGGPVELRASPGGPALDATILACESVYASLDGTNLRRFAVRSRKEGWLELAEVPGPREREPPAAGWIPAAGLRGAYALTDGQAEIPAGLHRPRIERTLGDRVLLRGETVPCVGEEATEEVLLPPGIRADRLRLIQRVSYDPDSDCGT